ncbi:hypothetical protein LCGC14_2011390, partial [marine sediment metagenome]
MSAPRMVAWIALVSAICLAGCNNQPNTVDSQGGAYREVNAPLELIAKAHPPILDLPVPIGFELN